MKTKKILLLSLGALLLACCLLTAGYLGDFSRADERAAEALVSMADYTVTLTDDRVVFSPALPEAGFIFYPGGKVEFTAYAPLMAALAEQNILCVIPKMPGNLAVLDMHAADGIPAEFPEISRWYMGGHSLGGSMAASHLAQNPDVYSGLILLASYATADLSELDIGCISLLGDRDTVLNRESYDKYRENLPENTTEITLEGCNHAGFGSYGPQEGDSPASVSPAAQTNLTAGHILAFLSEN